MSLDQLKQKLRDHRDDMPEGHAIRLHRALSWVTKAEELQESDVDNAFINAWIGLNACYSLANGVMGDTKTFKQFASRVTELDNRIYDHLWFNYSKFVKSLTENQYVYEPFWQSYRQGNDHWRDAFEKRKAAAMRALANNDASTVLQIALASLYTLRNQLVHGGATYGSKVNREQVTKGTHLLLSIVPVIIDLMIDYHDKPWGEISYPVVDPSKLVSA